MKNIIDISIPLNNETECYKGDPVFGFEKTFQLATGDDFNLSKFNMGMHTGTHVDAPNHFLRNGRTAEAIDLEVLAGHAQVIQLKKEGAITVDDLESRLEKGVKRLIVGTRYGGSRNPRPVSYFTDEASIFLLEKGVKLVGTDSLSVDSTISSGYPIHSIFLSAAVIIVENLDLRNVDSGFYRFICLPLKIVGAEAAPARAILEPLNN